MAARASPPRAVRRQQRRQRILDAGLAVFAEKGFAGASVKEIAARAGVVASVFYDHFVSKRQLYLELLLVHGQALISYAIQPRPGASYEELFLRNIEAYYEFVEEDPFVWRMLFRDPPPDREIAAVHAQIHRRAVEAIAALVGSLQPDQELIPGVSREDANLLIAQGIKSAIEGVAAWWYENRYLTQEQVIAAARQVLWSGLGDIAVRLDEGGERLRRRAPL